eukprot:TRINITY_DN24950_c0_g1_i1.p1 TRINITY_DN24950_c0_g1~~TRINITY_DN24950_c0_g1_i1.p1  ORF type:complete len:160 (+),score=54.50 TRINITY_DN24950_c0_g1_i1:79-558(+)
MDPTGLTQQLMPLVESEIGKDAIKNHQGGVMMNAKRVEDMKYLKDALEKCVNMCKFEGYYAQCTKMVGDRQVPAPAPPGFLDKDPFPMSISSLISRAALSTEDRHQCTLWAKGKPKFDDTRCFRDCMQWESHILRMDHPELFKKTGKSREFQQFSPGSG